LKYRQPESVTDGSTPDRLGEAVVGAVAALPLSRPRILEVGCSTGWLAPKLAALGSYEGWDISDGAVELARRNHPSCRFETVDIHDVGFGGQPFDVVVCVDAVAYFRDQDAALTNARSLLAPGGYLVLTTVNPYVYSRMSWIGPPGEGQVRKWLTKSDLRDLLERTSFQLSASWTILPDGDQGVLRWINSRKLNTPVWALLSTQRVEHVKEAFGLGQYRVVVATSREAPVPEYVGSGMIDNQRLPSERT
jgi:SAM-dependent methyltransferase